MFYPAWTYNGQVPGPTIRCTEGDRLRIRFTNKGSHSHSIHFHGVHPSNMDGAFEPVQPGRSFTYEFDAEPFGLHLYHCHTVPIKRHIHKGLYGAFIIDPKEGRPPAKELVMVMNAFDTNFDGENEVYAVNTVAFHYQKHPIRIRQHELVRVYVVNVTEFDLLNSFHLHGNLYRLYRTGTDLQRYEWTDMVALARASGRSSSSPTSIPARSCSTPTRASSPSWVGAESSWWSRPMPELELPPPAEVAPERAPALPRWLLGLGPLILLAALVALFVRVGPVGVFRQAFPPVEELTIERDSTAPAGRDGGARRQRRARARHHRAGDGRRRQLGSQCRRRSHAPATRFADHHDPLSRGSRASRTPSRW